MASPSVMSARGAAEVSTNTRDNRGDSRTRQDEEDTEAKQTIKHFGIQDEALRAYIRMKTSYPIRPITTRTEMTTQRNKNKPTRSHGSRLGRRSSPRRRTLPWRHAPASSWHSQVIHHHTIPSRRMNFHSRHLSPWTILQQTVKIAVKLMKGGYLESQRLFGGRLWP